MEEPAPDPNDKCVGQSGSLFILSLSGFSLEIRNNFNSFLIGGECNN